MYDGSWDPYNPDLPINQLIEEIRNVDDASLSEDEIEDKKYALWLWNHHAISFAIFRSHDKEAAKRYAEEALRYENGHNKITKLFALLLDDQVDEATRYIEALNNDDPEKATAKDLLRQATSGEWF
jgi:hypothetical protein